MFKVRMTRRTEGNKCSCETLAEHDAMVNRVDASFAKDYDGSRRRYADQVSTSQALRKRALAPTNGSAR